MGVGPKTISNKTKRKKMNISALNYSTLENPVAIASHKNGKELSRLITAAVVNQRFRELLLTNPAKAIAKGFNGEVFYLASEEQDLVLSIRASSLADFAMQLAKHQNGKSQNGNGYGSGNSSWGKRQLHQKA
jgi:hypothetical protein